MKNIALIVDDDDAAIFAASLLIKRYMDTYKPDVRERVASRSPPEKVQQIDMLAVPDSKVVTIKKMDEAISFMRDNHPNILVVVMDREIEQGGSKNENVKGEEVLRGMAAVLDGAGIPKEEWPWVIPNSGTNNQVLADEWPADRILEELNFKQGEKPTVGHSPLAFRSAPVSRDTTPRDDELPVRPHSAPTEREGGAPPSSAM